MEEINWYVGARISRGKAGGCHWFVESSDGLSHGNLVDEGVTPGPTMACVRAREAFFGELVRLINAYDLHEPPAPEQPPLFG